MNNRIDAIYARQSVDKKDSISIESQIEFCRYELKGGASKEYQDKGFSGKNTDRPQFQQLVKDIEAGLIARVIVYKLDRISRSILDFSKMMEMFQKYNVEFVSSTEKFDTSTPMGRAIMHSKPPLSLITIRLIKPFSTNVIKSLKLRLHCVRNSNSNNFRKINL